MASLSVKCSVSDCGAKREKQSYCLQHFLQFKQDDSASSSSSNSTSKSTQIFNPYTEFKEMTRKEIQDYIKKFKQFDENGDNEIDFLELTRMMEKIGQPQTHIGLKGIMTAVDEDKSGGISLKEFLLMVRKVKTGDITLPSLVALAKEINVAEEGVGGAKNFFEAHADKQKLDKKNEEEIKQEQLAKKAERDAAAQRKAAFKEKANAFKS